MPLFPAAWENDRTLNDLIPLLSPAVWFKFLDVGGTTVTDSSGNGRNGTAVAGTGSVTLADGTATITAGGRITIADNAAFSVPTAGGFTVWCLEASSAGSYLITKGGNGGVNFEWQISRPTAQMSIVTHTATGGSISSCTSTTLTGIQAGRINAVGGAFWDRTASSPHMCSINGQSQRPTPSTTASGYADGTSVVTLGSRVDQATADFAGVFYQMAIFPFAMDPVGMLALSMAAVRSGLDVPLAA